MPVAEGGIGLGQVLGQGGRAHRVPGEGTPASHRHLRLRHPFGGGPGPGRVLPAGLGFRQHRAPLDIQHRPPRLVLCGGLPRAGAAAHGLLRTGVPPFAQPHHQHLLAHPHPAVPGSLRLRSERELRLLLLDRVRQCFPSFPGTDIPSRPGIGDRGLPVHPVLLRDLDPAA